MVVPEMATAPSAITLAFASIVTTTPPLKSRLTRSPRRPPTVAARIATTTPSASTIAPNLSARIGQILPRHSV